jgi:hypothetical protein
MKVSLSLLSSPAGGKTRALLPSARVLAEEGLAAMARAVPHRRRAASAPGFRPSTGALPSSAFFFLAGVVFLGVGARKGHVVVRGRRG